MAAVSNRDYKKRWIKFSFQKARPSAIIELYAQILWTQVAIH